MEFIAFTHPKEKLSTIYVLFSHRKGVVSEQCGYKFRHPTLTSAYASARMGGFACVPSPYSTASSGIGREHFQCVSFGLSVKQTQNKKNQDVKFISKQIPRCTVVWKSLVNLPLIIESYFLNDLFKRTASVVFASKAEVFTWNY